MRVAYDAELLVVATAFADPADYAAWPDIPPVTDQPARDCLAAVASSPRFGNDVTLVVSHEVLSRTQRLLRDEIGLDQADINAFLMAVIKLAIASGQPPVPDPPPGDIHVDGEPGLLLRLATGPYGGNLVVGMSPSVLELGPQWGNRVFVLPPDEFAKRIDAHRRAR